MAATLSVLFEAEDLFVLTHAIGLADLAEARRLLIATPSLLFDRDWTSVLFVGREPRRLCPYDNDECGRWPLGADRECPDEFQAASMPMPDFMALKPEHAAFNLVWFSMSEWEKAEDGTPIRLIASALGSIGTLAPDQ